MALLTPEERTLLRAVSTLAYCNPFLPERIDAERAILGADFVEGEPVWSMRVDAPHAIRVNNARVSEQVEREVRTLRERLTKSAVATEQDLLLYEDAVLLILFDRYQRRFYDAIVQALSQKRGAHRWGFYAEFVRDWESFFHIPDVTMPVLYDAPHLFACFFQVRRAFHHIIESIIGSSMAAARLRAAVWQETVVKTPGLSSPCMMQ